MSSPSLDDLSKKYLNKSASQSDGSGQSGGYSNSVRCTEDKYSIGSIEQSSIYENSPFTGSVKMKISPISTAVNSVDMKIESSLELEDTETSTQRLQTGYKSFNSHQKMYLDSENVLEDQFDGDLQLPLAEEQDAKVIAYESKNLCTKKGDPIENLVLATLAFREASHNQCDLLRAQTSAINRLATAIEEQNVMMSRFHTAQKISTKTLPDNDGGPLEDDQK